MKELYQWIQNLTGFFLFLSVAERLLPGKQYGKYLRLFSGMVLVFIVLHPFTEGLHLEDTIAGYYESFLFQEQAEDLKQNMSGMEKQRLSSVIRRYEEAVEEDVIQLAEEMGIQAAQCSVTIEAREDNPAFGTICSIRLIVKEKEGAEAQKPLAGEQEEEKTTEAVEPVRPVMPVEVKVTGRTEERELEEPQKTEKTEPVLSGKILGEMGQKEKQLREKLEAYYHLEESNVEIQMAPGA